MTLPNFLFIGTGKAGSTSLYYYLNEHPDIYMSPVKETNFFSYEGGRPDFCGPGDRSSIASNTTITSIQDYHANFQGVTKEKAIGEMSPSYLYLPEAPKRIKRHIPKAKMIVILRNPVERAYSNYQHKVRDDLEPEQDFLKVIKQEKSRIEKGWSPSWHYIKNGFYYTQLRRYFNYFDEQQFRIYLFEEWVSNPLALYQDILRFIEVDETFVPNLETKYNISGKPKSRMLHRFLTQPNPLKSTLKSFIPKSFLRTMAARTLYSNLDRLPKLSVQSKCQLMDLYRDDILKLQDLINKDLSSWLNVEPEIFG